MPRGLAYGLGGLLLVVALLLTLFYLFQRRLIYLPATAAPPPAGSVLPGASDVSFETADGLRLAAWFVPAGAPERGLTVLVAPGNAGDRSLRAPLADALRRHGYSVLLVDYRGYGGNPGAPTESGLALDIRAARDFLLAEKGVRAEELICFGESLGAAVIAGLAAERPCAGVLLRSPFADLASVGSVHYPFLPVRALLKDEFPVAETVRHVRAPTVVVLGTADSIVPPEQSRQVAAAAAGLTEVVEVAGAEHNDLALLAGADLIGAVDRLAELITRR
ncbi:MAG TPA: alpha/beta hydrolase [Actinophytocola sp.]|uniref:alpha/beta hydrolase n=1 Tax=Actinophytocola sp. TaxID=1872138 RepID=UPI002DBED508|nr:alpha/beta hydrolase [Actinophytocola sp.]HEU5472899.1 alpha/beta hydrolase [Actinophytocola sp.]